MNLRQPADTRALLVMTGFLLLLSAFAFTPGSAGAGPQTPGRYSESGSGTTELPGDIRQMRIYGDPGYHYKLGRHLQKRGKHRLAVQEFKSAVRAGPDWACAFNAMGISLDAMEKRDQAVKAYKEALKREPERAEVLNNLGYSHLGHGDSGSAVYYINKAVTLDPDNMLYRNNLGAAYVKEGNFDAALEEFRMAADTPGEARMRLAGAMLRSGHETEARKQMIMANSLEDMDVPAILGREPAENPGAAGDEMTEGKDKPETVDAVEDQSKGEK